MSNTVDFGISPTLKEALINGRFLETYLYEAVQIKTQTVKNNNVIQAKITYNFKGIGISTNKDQKPIEIIVARTYDAVLQQYTFSAAKINREYSVRCIPIKNPKYEQLKNYVENIRKNCKKKAVTVWIGVVTFIYIMAVLFSLMLLKRAR